MSITIESTATQECITMTGELTIFTVSELWQSLQQPLSSGKEVQIDLLGVSEFDTAGIQLLMVAKQLVQKSSGSLCFLNHSQTVIDGLQLFDLAGYFGDPLVLKSAQRGVQP
jgi:anti-sigma B factor antagonist